MIYGETRETILAFLIHQLVEKDPTADTLFSSEQSEALEIDAKRIPTVFEVRDPADCYLLLADMRRNN